MTMHVREAEIASAVGIELRLDDWKWWSDALTGNIAPVHDGAPQTGYYRLRRMRDGRSMVPVAYWRDTLTGEQRCHVEGQDFDTQSALEIWPFVAKSPVTIEAYQERLRSRKWADEPAAVIDANAPASLAIEQGSAAWVNIRLGKVTASRVADVVAKTKSGWSASRANYMAELIAERLTGQQASSYTNAAMQWGTEKEPEARMAYSFRSDVDVLKVGFVPHPKIAMTGASPDGYVAADGLVEFKCPNTATHIDTLLGDPIPAKYLTQMQWQMACAGRAWCDWVSYDPRLPREMQIFIQRVPRDDATIATLEKQVTEFLAALEQKTSALRDRYVTNQQTA